LSLPATDLANNDDDEDDDDDHDDGLHFGMNLPKFARL
jgi:hypothetical protein